VEEIENGKCEGPFSGGKMGRLFDEERDLLR
jgi:hypothetical protein